MTESPGEQLTRLWNEGFFKVFRTVHETEDRMGDEDFHPAPAALRMALRRAQFLRAGDKEGILSYVQRFPANLPSVKGAAPRTKAGKGTEARALLHPAIDRVSSKRIASGQNADAVEAAMKLVNKRVKEHVKATQEKELDGTGLMSTAFSPTKPLITLADMTWQTGRDVQQGYMYLFMGAIMGIRNPKAHDVVSIDRKRALQMLVFASLLMCKLDDANVGEIG